MGLEIGIAAIAWRHAAPAGKALDLKSHVIILVAKGKTVGPMLTMHIRFLNIVACEADLTFCGPYIPGRAIVPTSGYGSASPGAGGQIGDLRFIHLDAEARSLGNLDFPVANRERLLQHAVAQELGAVQGGRAVEAERAE